MQKEKVFSEVKLTETQKIKPNQYNPNKMTEEQFEALVADFRENGWIGQPVVVNEKLEIIDGFHRWKAGEKIGLKKVPVVVFKPKSKDHQKILTIAFNSKRGEMNPLKLAGLVEELNRKYSLEELSVKLGYSQDSLKDKLALNQITEEFIEKVNNEAKEREKEVPVVMNFAVSKKQENYIIKTLEKFQGKSKGERLYNLCYSYLK